jgi:hypothetical protein
LEWFKADGREVYRPGLAAKKEPTRTHPCAEVPVILDISIVLDRFLVKREDAIYACHLLFTGIGDQFRCAGAT